MHQHIPRAFSATCYLHILKERQFFWAERQKSQYPWPVPASLTALCRCTSPLPLPKSQYHSQGMGAPSSAKSVRGQNSWVLTNWISHQTDKMYVEKLELFSKFLSTSTFIWELWWGGEEQGRGNSRSATCRTNPGFPSSSNPGHFTPAGLGAQFAPVSEGAGEPCSCRVT